MSKLIIDGRRVNEDELSGASTKAGRQQRDCLRLFKEHERSSTIPTNLRFLGYELMQRGLIEKAYRNADGSKTARQPKDDIARTTMYLRERGIIPWDWIIDETREILDWRYAPNVHQYLIDAIPFARIDRWNGKLPPLTICESRATKGVLARIAQVYGCPITATGGQCGGFLVTDVVPYLRGNGRRVLYIGDCELRGPADQIEANTRRYIEQHTGRTFDSSSWMKIALIETQVNANKWLRKLKIEKVDRRYKPPKPYEAVECEAIGQAQLEKIYTAALDELLPEPLERVLAREQRQRAREHRTRQ